MSQENVKVVVEIYGGIVNAVYAGNPAQPMIDVVIIDHDSATIEERKPTPLKFVEHDNTKTFYGKRPDWFLELEHNSIAHA